MAITTIDGALAGMQEPEEFLKVGATMEAAGVRHSFFYTSGLPGAAVAPTPGLGGAALTTYAGQIPWGNPGAGNSYLARFEGTGTTAGTLILADRLWHNSGFTITTTTAQTVTSVAFPARDKNGSTNGEGVLVGIEASGAIGGGAVANTTMSYTPAAGGGPNTATMASWPATAVAGTFVPFQLAAGDTGVRAITSLTLGTTYTSGTIHLVAYRKLAQINCPVANVGGAVDALTSGFVRLFDNTVPFLIWVPSVTTATTVGGTMIVTQG